VRPALDGAGVAPPTYVATRYAEPPEDADSARAPVWIKCPEPGKGSATDSAKEWIPITVAKHFRPRLCEVMIKNTRTAGADVQPIGDRADNNARDATASPLYRIRVADASAFSTQRMCPIRHNYHEHPLMQLDRLAQLAKSLETTGQCRFIQSGATQASPFTHAAQSPDGSSIEDVFRRIEEPGSWIALYNVESDTTYGRFLREVLSGASALFDPNETVFMVTGFIFISAPPSVTPFHIDRENNFWLQIRGRKKINVWDRTDREIVAAEDVEDFIVSRSLENVRLKEEFRSRSSEFDTGPGDGVYFPSTTPHMTRTDTRWARPGDGVCISIGINFYTSVTRRHANVHAFNKVLRRMGMTPRSPGTSPWLDRLKYPLGCMVVGLKRHLRGYSPPPGF
jgi:hypothetical protein